MAVDHLVDQFAILVVDVVFVALRDGAGQLPVVVTWLLLFLLLLSVAESRNLVVVTLGRFENAGGKSAIQNSLVCRRRVDGIER